MFTITCNAHSEDKKEPHQILFSSLLPDVPGKRMILVEMTFEPNDGADSSAHRHPGSVLVYVLEGKIRMAMEGQSPIVLEAGDTFYETPGLVHTIAENVSSTESAKFLAVLLVPDGEDILTLE